MTRIGMKTTAAQGAGAGRAIRLLVAMLLAASMLSVSVVRSAASSVVVTDCTTSGYSQYLPNATTPDIGLGGALDNGNTITFDCDATLSGGSGPYTIVPQGTSEFSSVRMNVSHAGTGGNDSAETPDSQSFSPTSVIGGAVDRAISVSDDDVSIDGSDGGKYDVTISGDNHAIDIFDMQDASLTLQNITLAYGLSAVRAEDGEATVIARNVTFANNAAGEEIGGAIDMEAHAGSVEVLESTFVDNSARLGGAIEMDGPSDATLSVANSTFTGNSIETESYGTPQAVIGNAVFTPAGGDSAGGAIRTWVNATILNSTFDANSAPAGSVFAIRGGTTSIGNTIVSNSADGGALDACSIADGTLTDLGGNLEHPSNSCGFSSASHDVFGDPLLGALADNGGPTETMALETGSAATGAGLTSICLAEPVGGVDQRGHSRSAGACAIGAYEPSGAAAATRLLPEYYVIDAIPDHHLGDPAVLITGTSIPGGTPTSLWVTGQCTTTDGMHVILTAVGTCTVSVFMPGGNGYMSFNSEPVTFRILPEAPAITWPSPADIKHGTALGANQLDATAPVSGIFSYAPAAGTVLPVGVSQVLTATFTPGDLTSYVPVTETTTITVTAGVQTLTIYQLPNLTVGLPVLVVTHPGASGQPVMLTTSGACKLGADGVTLTPTDVGTCTVVANEAGNSQYDTAAPVVQSVPVQAAQAP